MKTKLLKKIRRKHEIKFHHGRFYIFVKKECEVLRFLTVRGFLEWYVSKYWGVYSSLTYERKLSKRSNMVEYKRIFHQ